MSCKGILPQTRNGSGQIEDECKKGLSDPLCFLKNGEYGFTVSDPILPDSNQDVADECSNGENTSSGVLEIASSANFILSSTQVTSDVVGISVDDWFKHKSDGSMDLDSVLTTDGIEVNDLEAYHFATSKDNVDMCIVTNICDMGLGFDLPVNMCDKCNHNVGECDCDETVVNEFVETSFLEDYKSDKEKSMLIKLNKPKQNEKRDTLSEEEKEIADSYIVQFQDKEVKDTNSKDCDWSQGEDVYDRSRPVVLNGEKVSWESLSSVSQHSTDYESEKDVDFSEFSLLTFQVENSEGINVINTLSQIDSVSDNDIVPGNVVVSEGCILPENVSLVESSVPQIASTSELQLVNTSKENCSVTNSAGIIETMCNALDLRTEPSTGVEPSPSTVIEKNNNSLVNKGPSILSTSHPRSLLRPSQKVTSNSDSPQISLLENLSRTPAIVRSDQELSTQTNGTKKAPSMTIIAISTDKSKNTTEIVINTSQGEQKFKGKTTDFIKATSKLFSSQTVKAKIGQNLNLSNVELGREEPTTTQTESESDSLKYEKNKAADDQPITEALAALGIDMSSIACVTTGGSNGYKLWVCPTPDCKKLYPRLSLLKVHILTHYGVRPYRCDVPGCHWTFYTFFKLKRHKETHLKRKSFVCPVPSCGHRFTTIYNLKTHRKLHERPAKLQCPVVGCDALFQTKRAVELHVRKHGISHAPYQCLYAGCGKRYYSNNTLNSHARSHQHKEEEVRCQWPDCGKWFDKPCRLKAHMRTHTGDKPYLCTFQNCAWAFSSASKLKRHQQKHTNERKFRCSLDGCGKSFMRSEHLKEHIQTHIGERSYQCSVANCGVKFTAKSSLYVHLKKHKQQLSEANVSPEKQPAVQFQASNSGQLLQQQQQQQQQQQPKSKQGTTHLVIPKWNQIGNGEPLQVILPASGSVFQCPVESCTGSYSCKASLRQHLLKHHTPVLASDTSQLDYVTSLLLSGSSNQNQQVLVSPTEKPVASSDGLPTVSVQGPVCTVAVSGADLNSTGLLTTSSLFDPGTTYSSEYVIPDLLTAPGINNMLVVSEPSEEGEVGAGNRVLLTSDSAADPTVSDPETELHLATESIGDPLLVGSFTNQRAVSFGLGDISGTEEDDEIVDDPTCQAARTNLTYRHVMSRKRLQYSTNNTVSSTDSKTVGRGFDNSGAGIERRDSGTCSSEPALADAIVGLRDPVTALCLPPDMAGLVTPTSDLNLLLQEESGYHVLLLDGGDSQFYTESTINLRDLE